MQQISPSDLILNKDGSIYHLNLKKDDIGDTIILVGDPGRVKEVSKNFDALTVQKSNREFHTHTGLFRGHRISAISTGIGTDNIDIVLNELDALVNVDLDTRLPREKPRSLRFVRLGTSGALREDIEPGATIKAGMACGFDGVYHFYRDDKGWANTTISETFMGHVNWPSTLPAPYFIQSPGALSGKLDTPEYVNGITISAPGFYAPQVRRIRLSPFDEDLVTKIRSFRFKEYHFNNFEMECSALYALSAMLGHEALTLCIAIANRVTKKVLGDYQPYMERLIRTVLETLTEND